MSGKNVSGLCVKFSDDGLVVGGWEDGFIRAYEPTKNKFSTVKWEIVNAHRNGVTCLFIVIIF